MAKKVSSAIGGLKRIRQYAPRKTLLLIYNSLIQAHFDYCDIVRHSGLNQEQSERLQKLQNRTARVITQAGYEIRSSDLLTKLGWDNLHSRRIDNSAIMMHKVYNGNSTDYLHECYNKRSEGNGHNLRNSKVDVSILKPQTQYRKKSFQYNGGLIWNSIPKEIRLTSTLNIF